MFEVMQVHGTYRSDHIASRYTYVHVRRKTHRAVAPCALDHSIPYDTRLERRAMWTTAPSRANDECPRDPLTSVLSPGRGGTQTVASVLSSGRGSTQTVALRSTALHTRVLLFFDVFFVIVMGWKFFMRVRIDFVVAYTPGGANRNTPTTVKSSTWYRCVTRSRWSVECMKNG